ncbi:acyl-CoA dehydrogenase family protein [Micromonospora inositola]|uniref:Acyl-CoA dehydrogenase n=1 Tax=Micromonospora inositola TaxID=47865 RepID=A0A1C5JN13_9ACTN|nr:acyl-CoA dehydrogenase family protein [Micromonospora inositola]SCG71984.1 Acyl-CoA dehydrogenase [Micromonospora inositola]
MDLTLSDEQRELVRWASEFAESKLAAEAMLRQDRDSPAEWQNHSSFLAQQGLLGLSLPEQYGGGGLKRLDALLVVEAVSRVCPYSGAIVRWTVGGPSAFIAELANPELKAAYLPDIARGAAAISVAMTEPDAGTASSDLTSRAVHTNGQYTITGSKIFITLADRATAFVVYCRFVEAGGDAGVGAIIVNRDAPGLRVGERIEWMGGNVYPLYLDDVVVDEAQVLISPQGSKDSYKRLMQTYNVERLGGLFELLGIAQLALDKSVTYARERHQFGKPIASFQAVQLRLADMAMRLAAARLLTYKAASSADNGTVSRLDVSMARVTTTEMVQQVTSDAMHIHGGYGLTKEFGLEWLYRFTRHHTIAGGTSDIHRSMIASDLTGLHFDHRE